MPQPERKPARQPGPWLVAALLRDPNASQDAPGDIGLLTEVSLDFGQPGPAIIAIMLIIVFAIDDGSGRHELVVTRIAPDGRQFVFKPQHPPVFAHGEAFHRERVPLPLEFRGPGLNWFEVELDGRLVARVPLRVIHVPGLTPPADFQAEIGRLRWPSRRMPGRRPN